MGRARGIYRTIKTPSRRNHRLSYPSRGYKCAIMPNPNIPLSRRDMIGSLAALAGASALPMPAWAMGQTEAPVRGGIDDLSGGKIDLHVGGGSFAKGGRSGEAVDGNGSMPGPRIRRKE